MKFNISNKAAILAMPLFFAMMFSTNIYAQDEEEDTGFEDDVDDEANLPIDSLLYAGLAGGALLGYRLLKKGETV